MRKLYISIVAFVVALLAMGCSQNSNIVGIEIQPDSDAIAAVVDVFDVISRDVAAPPVSAQCDTSAMLLGNFYNARYGGTKADLLVQFMPPEGYNFPADALNPTPDSLVLTLTYNGFCGSKNEPFEIAVYEMTSGNIEYNKQYLSDLNVNDYCDRSILMGKRISTSIDQTLTNEQIDDEDFQPYISYKFTNEQLQRFFNMPKSVYESREKFLNEFKGIYMTMSYGQSTMLYLREVYLQLFYHYTYKKNGVDTVMSTYITYPASHEVRQLNAISHPNREQFLNKIDSVNVIKAAGGIYTEVEIPIGEMRRRIHDSIGNKMMMMNSALLSFEVTNVDLTTRNLPMFSYLLMLPSDKVEEFVKSNAVPTSSDIDKVVGYYSIVPNKEYQFDLAYLLAKRLREDPTNYDEVLKMTVLPVSVVNGITSNSVSSIRPMKQLSAASVRNSSNSYSPMRIEISYSGF
ncbi:MAG: DUF4270 domain-containing protein [Paludibacteraceae bacterium]|nr:DUF4270 domain-containing protein [Paludibacteraceae bacterium]